jgi:hypothetical protein
VLFVLIYSLYQRAFFTQLLTFQTSSQDVGDFGTLEEALALQKPFNQSSTTDPESILTDKGLNVLLTFSKHEAQLFSQG